jgi:hypothetical protein
MTKFKATLELGGKTATGMCVPPEVVEELGAGKRPPVRVTINGYTYRSTIAVMGGRFMLGVSADVRAAAGVKAGDVVDVGVELDTEKRELALPAEFAKALRGEAKKFFEGLSYSKKQRFVLPIEKAKTDETRKRNIAKAIEALKEGRVI